MANPVLLAIGGTGQHVALAAARMSFLGALPPMRLLTVDADDRGPLSERLKTFGGTVKSGLSEHPFEDGDRIFQPFDRGKLSNPRFSDLFLDSTSSASERETFELLFDEAAAGISVNDGMFGQPSVGATIFAQNKDAQLRDVFTAIGNASHVFVAGSFIGGTGAGIVHQLVRAITTRHPALRVYGLFVLPWFSVAAASGATTRTVDDGGLKRNMQYGLHYFYEATRAQLKASLLIGAPDAGGPFGKKQVGNSDHGELETPLMFVAATGLRTLPEITVKQDAVGAVFASASNETNGLHKEVFGQKPFSWFYNRGCYVQKILNYVSGSIFRDNLDSAMGLFGSGKTIGEGLYLAIKDYKKEKQKPNIAAIQETWALLSRQYEFSLTWTDRVIGPPPLAAVDARVKQVDDKAAIAAEIQRLWREPLPKEQGERSPVDVAREFYQRLVGSFGERG